MTDGERAAIRGAEAGRANRIAAELADRFTFTLGTHRRVVADVIRAVMRLGDEPSDEECVQRFMLMLMRELSAIESGLIAQRCAEVEAERRWKS